MSSEDEFALDVRDHIGGFFVACHPVFEVLLTEAFRTLCYPDDDTAVFYGVLCVIEGFLCLIHVDVLRKSSCAHEDDVGLLLERDGVEGIKEATYKVGDLEVNVAIASGLANARKLLDMVKSGEKKYHFIEIMACPGGCVNGGGQPLVPASIRNFEDIRALRAKALYSSDEANKIRFSHENESIKKVYADFFGEPGSHKAHEILHTSYVPRVINQ